MPSLVSILIPAHNAERWLEETLESALAQTWPAIEIIVVNDGSTDNTAEVLRRFLPRGVLVINQTNLGQSTAFNTAIKAARGEYYEFLDADDLLAPDKIGTQMNRLTQLPENTLATGCWSRFYGDPREAVFEHGPVAHDMKPLDWITTLWSQDAMMHGAAWLVPAGLVRKAGGWNDKLSLINDFEFFSRLVLASPGVAYCPGARSYYRSNLPGSLSGQKSEAAWESAFLSVGLGTKHLLQVENSCRTREACAVCWRNLVFDSYPAVPELRNRAMIALKDLNFELGHPRGGPWFRCISRLLGWKAAKRLQAWRTALF